MTIELPAAARECMLSFGGVQAPAPLIGFSDVSYLDDSTYCCWSKTAGDLQPKVVTLVRTVADVSKEFGFSSTSRPVSRKRSW